MATVADEDADAILSDVESEEPSPIIVTTDPPREDSQHNENRIKELTAELDREKKAREASEASKSDLQTSFNRLKSLAHEAIKKRDESKRERDDAVKELDNLNNIIKSRDDALNDLKLEIDNASHMLVSGIDKISSKVVTVKNFGSNGLPKSSKYNGLASVAYGVIKRTNEIVDEIVKEIDKSRNVAREEIDQRNYEIAIEVSQLESTISNLRLDVAEKANVIDDLETVVGEKEKRIVQLSEVEGKVGEYDVKLKEVEGRMVSQRALVMEQLSLVGKIHEELYEVVKVVDVGGLGEFDESLFVSRETEGEENVRACLAGMESIFELTGVVSGKVKSLVEERGREVRSLSETVGRLVKEKEDIGTLLRSALSERMVTEEEEEKSELFQAAENGLRDVGVDLKSSKEFRDHSTEENEIFSLASTLENIVKASQLKIVQLQHSLEESREETSSLRKQLDSQTKELSQRMREIEQLKEKERIANENVEGLMTDIAAAEEEIARWKVAAEQEAAAGGAVEQDFTSQLYVLKEELEEAKQAIVESEKKLKFKEETAAAAMGARDAAEKSLRLADNRATRLRERIQELNRKIEELETHRDLSTSNRARYVCWPWQLLGIDFVGGRRIESGEQQQSMNEMELAEPLL